MFPGFSKEGMQFLRQLKRHNRREWFQPRKEIFERELKRPMEALIDEINHALERFAPDYVTEPKKAMFRIYRDTRFSSDKTPYKTHVAAWFKRQENERTTAGGFYFHVSPEGVYAAGGVYMPPPDQQRAIRTHLLDHHERFRRLASGRKLRTLLGEMEGASLSRDPKGFPKDHPAADLIRRKQWAWGTELEAALALTPKILPEVVKRFEAVAPLVEFLNEPFLVRKPRREMYFE
jgi:uncharacterized protein (TIGR02453 family)